jgi:hypothetical protein
MFSIETVSSLNVADVYMTSKRSLLYGVVELNAKDTYPAGAARLVLAGGVGAAAGAAGAGWPAAMAEGVARTLEGFTSSEYPSHVMGAFLSVSDGLIHLCWAGTIRVHLIRRGAAIRVTNDHNLIDDPLKGVTETLLSSPPDMIAAYRDMPSRTIGPGASRPPESQVWEMEPRDVLLICSAYVHWNAAPSEYVQKIIGDHTAMIGCDSGLIALIRSGPPVG